MDINVRNELSSLYISTEYYKRMIAFGLDSREPIIINIAKDNLLYKDLGIHQVYFRTESDFDVYADLRILLKSNKDFILTILNKKVIIDRYWSKEKMKSERLCIYNNTHFKIDVSMMTFIKYDLYSKYKDDTLHFSSIEQFKSFIKYGVDISIEYSYIFIDLNKVSMKQLYNFFIYLLPYRKKYGNLSIKFLNFDNNRVVDVDNILLKFDNYANKHSERTFLCNIYLPPSSLMRMKKIVYNNTCVFMYKGE